MEPLPDFLKPLEFAAIPFPHAALEEVQARREEATPHLLRALEQASEDGWRENDQGQVYMLHLYALCLLAEWREPRAFPLAVQLFRDPEYEDLTGDIVSYSLPSIFASICGEDIGPIQALIEDEDLDEWVRAAAVRALSIIMRDGRMTRGALCAYLGELLRSKLEREPGYVWDAVVEACVSARLVEHLPAIRQAYAEDLPDTFYAPLEDVEVEIALPSGVTLDGLEKLQGLFSDTAAELSEWTCYQATPPRRADDDREFGRFVENLAAENGLELEPPTVSLPIRVEPKPGRNDPCSCGSGLKYKKCCG